MSAERIRLIIDTDDVVRRAVYLRKIKAGDWKSVSDIVNEILREALAPEIKELEQHSQNEPPPKKKKPRGE